MPIKSLYGLAISYFLLATLAYEKYSLINHLSAKPTSPRHVLVGMAVIRWCWFFEHYFLTDNYILRGCNDEDSIMIKGLAITPPVLGRISIGKIVEKDGKRLPQKDDQFSITTQIQNKDGWVKHPLDELLRQQNQPVNSSGQHGNHSQTKLRTIPVRLLFNDPDLNLRVEYSLFDRQTGRPVCVGNGETCQRFSKDGYEQLPCPSPDLCPLGKNGNCKPYGRLNVCITPDHAARSACDHNGSNQYHEDELGTFIFRTTGFNSIRTLAARLSYYHAVSGNLLSCLPLQLKLRGKSTTQSYRSAIYYVDLTVRDGLSLNEAIQQAKTSHQLRLEAGFEQVALDQAAKAGFDNGLFELSEDEADEVLEEFYADTGEGAKDEQVQNSVSANPVGSSQRGGKLSLKQKLESKAGAAA